MDTLKALRSRSVFAFTLALAIGACGSEDPKTTDKPMGAGDGDTGDGDTGDGDTGDGDTGDGDVVPEVDAGGGGEIPETVELPYAVDAFHVPSGFMGQGALMPCPIVALPGATSDDHECGGNRSPGSPVGACHTFTFTPVADAVDQWAGVFWTFGDGNWKLPGIKIAAGAKKVSFYARADAAVTLKFAAGMKAESDGFNVETPATVLGKEWKQYTIDLSAVKYSTVNGAFAWTIDNAAQAGKGPYKFFIDNIEWQ